MPAAQQRMGLGVQHRFKPTVCEHAHPFLLQRVVVAACVTSCDDAGCSCDPEYSARCDKRAEQRAVRPTCSTHALATHRYSTSSHSVFRASEEAQRQSFLDCTSTHSKRAPLNPGCNRTESTHFLLQTQRGPRRRVLQRYIGAHCIAHCGAMDADSRVFLALSAIVSGLLWRHSRAQSKHAGDDAVEAVCTASRTAVPPPAVTPPPASTAYDSWPLQLRNIVPHVRDQRLLEVAQALLDCDQAHVFSRWSGPGDSDTAAKLRMLAQVLSSSPCTQATCAWA